MSNFITKYIREKDMHRSEFRKPATLEQIDILEENLGISLPVDYRDFLSFTDGFEGFIDSWFVRFSSVEQLFPEMQEYCNEFFPWAVCIGTNGGGEMFVIDKRQVPYQFGILPSIGGDEDFFPLGDTFEKLILRLYNDTAFDRL